MTTSSGTCDQRIRGSSLAPAAGGLKGSELGLGSGDGVRVRLTLGVFGQCPVDAGQAGVAALAPAGGDKQSGRISSTVSPFARRRSTVCSMSSVITGGRPPWFPLRAAAFRPSRVASRMFSRSVSAIAAKKAASHAPTREPTGTRPAPSAPTWSAPATPDTRPPAEDAPSASWPGARRTGSHPGRREVARPAAPLPHGARPRRHRARSPVTVTSTRRQQDRAGLRGLGPGRDQ